MNIESIARDTITTEVDPMSSLLDGHATLLISIFISLKKFVNLFAIILSNKTLITCHGDKHPIPGFVAQ